MATADRVNASTLTTGYKIIVERDESGALIPTRRKRNVIEATVADPAKTVVPPAQYEMRSRYVIHTDQGDTIAVTPIQTFTLVSAPGTDDQVDQGDTEASVALSADPAQMWRDYEMAKEWALAGDQDPPSRDDMRPRIETFRGRKLRVERGQGWDALRMLVNGQHVGSASGFSADAMNRAAAQLRRDVLAADERRVTEPDAYPGHWFTNAEPLPAGMLALVRYRAAMEARDSAAQAMMTCTDPAHVPGVLGCGPAGIDCSGVPARFDFITTSKIGTVSPTGFCEIGLELHARLSDRLPGEVEPVHSGESDPYGRRSVRDFTFYQLVARGHTVTVVHYTGRPNPAFGHRDSYIAVFIDGRLVKRASAVPAAQPSAELTRWLSWVIAEELPATPVSAEVDQVQAPLVLGERTPLRTTMPDRAGNGVSRRWSRTIGAHRYSFTVVNMPSGELRLFAEVYNGYGDNGTPESREIGMRFGCAWTPVHSIILPAGNGPDGGNGGGPTDPDDPAPVDGGGFQTWDDVRACILDGAPAEQDTQQDVPASAAAPAGRLVTVTNDGCGELRIHAPGCRDIARDTTGNGAAWDIVTADVATVVIDIYGGATYEDWRGYAEPRVMPCAGTLPDQVDAAPAEPAVNASDDGAQGDAPTAAESSGSGALVPASDQFPARSTVAPRPGEMIREVGVNGSVFVLDVRTDGIVGVDAEGPVTVAYDRVEAVEVLTAFAVVRDATHLVAAGRLPDGLLSAARTLATSRQWAKGKPEAGQRVTVLAVHDTNGERLENVQLMAEKVDHLGCGCFRIECYRPGPVDGGYRSWVSFLTGCTWHEPHVAAPMPPAAALKVAEAFGRESHRDGVPADTPASNHPDIARMIRSWPVGQSAGEAILDAYRRGYLAAAEAQVADQVRHAKSAHDTAAATAVIAQRNPAAQEMADLHARQAAMADREVTGRAAELDRARAQLGEPGETEPAARWEFLGRISSAATNDSGRARWARYVAAIRRVHNLPDDISHDDLIRARNADPRPWADKCAAYWDAYAALMAEEGAERTASAEPHPARAADGDADAPARTEPDPAAPHDDEAALVEAARDSRMVKRPKVGAYIHHDEHGLCEVVAVHGRSGGSIGVRTAAGERLSLPRHHRAHWLVVEAPAVDQTDDEGQQGDAADDGEPGSIYRLPVEAYTPELDSDEDAAITVQHDHEGGTVIEGSVRGDGVWEVAQGHGMECRRGVIFKRHSRDRFADLHALGELAAALRQAGHTVAVEVDDVWRPAAVREDARAVRVSERAERLAERASRKFAEANTRRLAARNIADGMPFGEPIKIGHHSERAHRRAFERIEANDRASYAARDYAEELARRADAAQRNENSKQGPRAIMRRLDTLKADRRGWIRRLADTDKGTAGYARLCRLHIERLSEDIAFQQAKLGDLAASGAFIAWSAETLQRGDQVNVGGSWREVARVNRKGVSVRALYQWHTRDDITPVTWDQIHGRRRDGVQHDTPNGDGWPVVDAQRVARWAGLVRSLGVTHDRDDTAEIMKRAHTSQALRLVLGIRRDATAQEVAAFGEPADIAGKRVRALACLAVFERLAAGETFDEIAETYTPIADTAPAWRMPDGEPVEMFGRELLPGDIVAGVWDDMFGARRLSTAYVGPVTAPPRHLDRRESGDWEIITIDGVEHEVRSFRRFAVHRATRT